MALNPLNSSSLEQLALKGLSDSCLTTATSFDAVAAVISTTTAVRL